MGRHKPLSPAAYAERRARERAAEREAARRPDGFGVNVAATALPSNADVELVRGARADLVQTGRRTDIFERFHKSGRLTLEHLHAVSRLQKDIEDRRGEGSRDLSIRERIDGGGADAAEAFVGRRVEAGRRADRALALCGRTSGRVLRALLEPAENGQWVKPMDVVKTIVGVDDFTGPAIAWACADLVAAFNVVDRQARAPAGQSIAA